MAGLSSEGSVIYQTKNKEIITIEEYKKDYFVIYQKAFDMFAENARFYPPQTYIILENGGKLDDYNITDPHFSANDPAELLKKFLKHKIKLLENLSSIKGRSINTL